MEETGMTGADDRRVLPHNFGPLRDASAHARLTGPCGDTVEIWLIVADGNIEMATATSDGCDDSIRASCMVADMVQGMPIDSAKALSESDVLSTMPGYPESAHHCVVLSLSTLQKAIEDYEVSSARAFQRTIVQLDAAATANAPANVSGGAGGAGSAQTRERRTIMVMSGKGGVGKSTVAVNLAIALAREGLRVGLVDVDVHGPSIPTMLNLHDVTVYSDEGKISPVVLGDLFNIEVMSLGFMLQHPDDPVVWRGPLKNSLIQQFLNDVQWGDLDYLVVDCPPGTGDEPLSVVQQLKGNAEAVLVTTPQEVSTVDVARSVNFAKQLKMPILGIVENMSGFVCPHCHTQTDIFRSGGGRMLSQRYGVPFLGAIPIDPMVGLSGDSGQPYVVRFETSGVSDIYKQIARTVRITRSVLS